jgi:hypothetical protein
MSTTKKLNIQWAAGLYEGEGSFSLDRRAVYAAPYPRLSLGSADRDVLVEFQRIVKGGRVNGPYERITPAGKQVKDEYKWTASGDEAARIARRLRPYVNGRRGRRIDEVLEESGR